MHGLTILELLDDILVDGGTEMFDGTAVTTEYDWCGVIGSLTSWFGVSVRQLSLTAKAKAKGPALGWEAYTLTRSSFVHIVSISSSMLSHSLDEMGTESGI